MDPINYARNRDSFTLRRNDLNFILSLRGFELGDNGKMKEAELVDTLTAAAERARCLKIDLEHRGVHPDVLKFCKAELLQDNYFHAVFEATKSVADKIRNLTELETDGAALVDEAFTTKYPLLIINKLRDENEKMEQKGFSMLLKGMFGIFRNTTAHIPKIKWEIIEADALDLFTIASYTHRRLDNSTRTGLVPKGNSSQSD